MNAYPFHNTNRHGLANAHNTLDKRQPKPSVWQRLVKWLNNP